ncbi:MAG TPA: TRZ/ATZ family hydrolase [Burkholderiales bacterium]|nr:TRZ/ATZ family hydrolase [Burkholderiales bacterium]
MAEPVDTLIEARWIASVEPGAGVLERHALVAHSGRIVALLPVEVARERYTAGRRYALDRHLLIPGLINLHTHAAMTLMRGYADDVALMDWLKARVWPVETRLANAEFVYDGTLLACAEMLRGGVTCFSDMYFFPEAAARAALAAGIRAALGMIVFEFPSAYGGGAADYLSKGLATRDAFGNEALLSFCLAPHAPYTVSDKTFAQVATYSAELDVPIHMHVHETEDEIRQSVAQFHCRPLARLRSLGLLGPNLIAVHCVHLDPAEIELLAEHGCHVAHCPSSNLKLASGLAPIGALVRRGVNVGIGTDGAASNNRLDVLGEMRLAALLAKGASGDATALDARHALAMATLNGACALGLEREIGSLAPGKAADIVAVDLGAAELQPCYDPISQLVYAAGREHVSHVWIGGEIRLDAGVLTGLDPAEMSARAASWRERIGALR